MSGKRRKRTAQPSGDGETGSASSAGSDGPQKGAGKGAEGSPFPIVGVGASAGGLEAFTQMLRALPVDTGMAFVLVQHLSPTHASMLAEILARTSKMQVAEVADEQQVAPNRVYVIPPDRDMIIAHGCLQLVARDAIRGARRPIDRFFRSLAEDQGHKAIGVILSGTASDGTVGLEEIKAEGGITFAQDDTAEQQSMPHSAIAAGCVDFVLPPHEIASEIGRIALHPWVAPASAAELVPPGEPHLARIMRLLRDGWGVDFTQYKANTLNRRIARRMVLHKLQSLRDYAQFLQGDPGEVESLYQDILIKVTRFFRDPEVFEALKREVFPPLFKERPPREPLRVWVPGCSTGEEAYSLAITIAELAAATTGDHVPVQIFGTDLNGRSIDKARAGVYANDIQHDLSPDHLRSFFKEVSGQYHVVKSIREMCVFARHNMLTDPPFAKMDLISCRNFLIYLEPPTQQKIVPLLHYALKATGFLVLGSSETVASYRELFEVKDAHHKIFAKKQGTRRLTLGSADGMSAPGPRGEHDHERNSSRDAAAGEADVQKETDRLLLARYAPPGVVISADLEILQFRGDTAPYLAPAPGKASLNLLKMARGDLLVALRLAISKAKMEDTSIRQEGLRVQLDGGYRELNLEVIPLRGMPARADGFLVLFEDAALSRPAPLSRERRRRLKAPTLVADAGDGEETAERQNARLRQELAATREYLQSLLEQQEAANEELQSASEEMQSANEELQSINEELETSKEEIQSTNEELVTVNEELQNRNLELNTSTNDMINLLDSVHMAVVMVGQDLRIRRFTPTAEKMLKLIPSDLGRRINDLKLPMAFPELQPLLAKVVETVRAQEQEVLTEDGCWYLLRIRPYRNLDDSVDGAVIMFVDVNTLKELQEALRRRVEELAMADRSKDEFLALLAHELRNPLAPLLNAVHVLASPGVDSKAAERAREVMNRQIHNMTRLIEDLLDVSRITQGKILLRREPVEVAALLRHAVEQSRLYVEARSQELSLSLAREPLYLDADPTRLEQIFGNLLNNASKFTHRGGHLELIVETASGGSRSLRELVVRVRDNGIGIAADAQPRVFELFAQAQHSLDHAQGGLGIGLTLVRSLVELHGGAIEVYSPGLGQGSEFTVRLPLSSSARAEPDQQDQKTDLVEIGSAGSAARRARRRVLVVDDNRDTTETLAVLLRLLGHEVAVAHTGPAALEAAAAFEPAVVLLDIGLPGLTGYEVATKLRQNSRLAGAVLVAVTGYGTEEDRRLAREAGFDHHLTKPVDPGVIYSLLEGAGDAQPPDEGG